jgi:peptidyl-prolyl cis-trans isomerase B (cyclophilin B)
LANKKSTEIQNAAKKSLKSFEEKQHVVDHRISLRRGDNKFALLATAVAFVVALAAQYSYFGFGPGLAKDFCVTFTQDAPTPTVEGEPIVNTIPDAGISECRDWTGVMKINDSDLGITLNGKLAPQAVANFIDLIDKGFYNEVSCHRLTTAGIFVLQCGDPNGNGTGGPGYSFGPIENVPVTEEGKQPTYKKGMLAMARSANDAKSMGSQFFIVYEDSVIPSDSAGGYTVFGEITTGLSGLDEIIAAGVKDGSSDGNPKTNTVVTSITVK